jgi:hypothetical protein
MPCSLLLFLFQHLLGIGGVRDIFHGVRCGIDTFDCVHPTRLGRHGGALVKASLWRQIEEERGPVERNRPLARKQSRSATLNGRSSHSMALSEDERRKELSRIEDICANITRRVWRLDQQQAELWKSLNSDAPNRLADAKGFSDKPRNRLLQSLDSLEAKRKSLLLDITGDEAVELGRTESDSVPVKEHISLVSNCFHHGVSLWPIKQSLDLTSIQYLDLNTCLTLFLIR